MVQPTSAHVATGVAAHLQYEVARDGAVLKKQTEVIQQQGEQALTLIRSSSVGQLLDIRV
jgi:hypothetical protein